MTITYLPLFPLPEVVLFPRTTMKLHIFEPRYLAMMDIVMAGEQRFALGQLREGYQSDYYGAPHVFKMATAVRILYADHLEDGRWNLMVEGIERILLRDEIQREPFRIGKFELIPEEIIPGEEKECFELAANIAATAEHIVDSQPQLKRLLSNLLNIHQHPSIVCDIIAGTLIADPYARQSALEETNILRRLRLVNIQLHHMIGRLEQSPVDQPGID
ncbi:LON peptidase substrate-binding domain-containing protein [soil metagenome]